MKKQADPEEQPESGMTWESDCTHEQTILKDRDEGKVLVCTECGLTVEVRG